MGGEQDMRNMGGLRKKIPITYWTMFAATLAIAGVPLFSGFFSKEAILDAAKDGPYANIYLWALGILGALLTSFYMFRLLFLTFFGEQRYDEHKVHVHESPKNMTVPLILLCDSRGRWRMVCGADDAGRSESLRRISCVRCLRPEPAASAPSASAENSARGRNRRQRAAEEPGRPGT